MLKCKDIVKLADKYIDGELSLTQRISFRMHLVLCKHCHRYIKNLSMVINSLKKSSDIEVHNCTLDKEIDEVYNLIKDIDTSTNKGESK